MRIGLLLALILMAKTSAAMTNLAPPNLVSTYGADPTGATDASAAFNLATAKSGYTFIPAGTYRLMNNLTAITASGVILEGAGRGCVKINVETTSGDVLPIGDGISAPSLTKISGISFVAKATRTDGYVIRARNAHDLTLSEIGMDYDGTHTFSDGLSFEGGPAQFIGRLDNFSLGHITGAAISVGVGNVIARDIYLSNGTIASCGVSLRMLAGSGIFGHDIDIIKSSSTGVLFSPGDGAQVKYVFLDRILADTTSGDNWLFQSTGSGATTNVTCSGCWGSTSGVIAGNGFNFNDPNSNGLTFSGSIAINNKKNGVAINAGKNIVWTGGFQVGNNSIGSSNYDNIFIAAGVSYISIGEGVAGDCAPSLPSTTRYGINVADGPGDYIAITTKRLEGNVTGRMLFGATGLNNVVQ
jgi:hypothetical protein